MHPAPPPRATVARNGIMDMIKGAFANEMFDDRRVKVRFALFDYGDTDPRAQASHILVKTEDEAADIKATIDSGDKGAAL